MKNKENESIPKNCNECQHCSSCYGAYYGSDNCVFRDKIKEMVLRC